MVNKTPELLGWLYDHLDKPWKHERRRLAFEKLNARPFVKLLKSYRPDIAICTHPLPAEIISWLKSKEKIETRQAIVVTDFDVHAMWLCRHYEHYFVALDETRVHLESLGVPASKITVSGIPIDPVFARPKDKVEMRRKYGLKPDLTTILVSAGGFGVGRIDALLASLCGLEHPAQVVAICGRNEKLKAKLDAQASRLPADSRVTLRPVGFTDAMDEYMAASDLLLGKPGGLTTSEALARGLALVIVNPIPGQEERNSDHLLEEGAAIRCNNPGRWPTRSTACSTTPPGSPPCAPTPAARPPPRGLRRGRPAVRVGGDGLTDRMGWCETPTADDLGQGCPSSGSPPGHPIPPRRGAMDLKRRRGRFRFLLVIAMAILAYLVYLGGISAWDHYHLHPGTRMILSKLNQSGRFAVKGDLRWRKCSSR